MKKLYIIVFSIFILSCSNKQKMPENDINKNQIHENIVTNNIDVGKNIVSTNNAETVNDITINEKLNMVIPEIGGISSLYLYSFSYLEFAEKDGYYGYEVIEKRLRNSYLTFYIAYSKPDEVAVIFDSNGIIEEIVPSYGDGHGFRRFVVFGKFKGDYDDVYYTSKKESNPFADKIIVTIDNYASSETSENNMLYRYKFYVYYTKVK